jgi:hypothetical protein
LKNRTTGQGEISRTFSGIGLTSGPKPATDGIEGISGKPRRFGNAAFQITQPSAIWEAEVSGSGSVREDHPAMVHFTCDHCGKGLHPGEEQHFVVKIEAYAAEDPRAITEADLEEDHLEAVSEMLRDMEDCGIEIDAPNKQFRYDLCHDCHKRFVQDPLGKDNAHKLFFSKN